MKNAIDHLFHEWNNKPAILVSYGAHSGSKCSSQLREVLSGLRMKALNKNVMIPFPTKKQITEGVPEEFDLSGIPHIQSEIIQSVHELLDRL